MCLPFWVVILRVTKQEIKRRKSVSQYPLVTPQALLPHLRGRPMNEVSLEVSRGAPSPQICTQGALSAKVAVSPGLTQVLFLFP